MTAYRFTYGTDSARIFNAANDDAARVNLTSYIGYGAWTDFTGARLHRYERGDQAQVMFGPELEARLARGQESREWLAAQGATGEDEA